LKKQARIIPVLKKYTSGIGRLAEDLETDSCMGVKWDPNSSRCF
jgi:hypothetical protein